MRDWQLSSWRIATWTCRGVGGRDEPDDCSAAGFGKEPLHLFNSSEGRSIFPGLAVAGGQPDLADHVVELDAGRAVAVASGHERLRRLRRRQERDRVPLVNEVVQRRRARTLRRGGQGYGGLPENGESEGRD